MRQEVDRIRLRQVVYDVLKDPSPLHKVCETVKRGAGRRQNHHIARLGAAVGQSNGLMVVFHVYDFQSLIVGGLLRDTADDACGSAAEKQELYMVVDDRAKIIVRDPLVLSAGNENDLFRESTRPRDGAAGAGSDGIVVPSNTVSCADQLNAVLHAAKFPGEIPDDLVGKYQAFTEANLTKLRAAGCDVKFHTVAEGVGEYMEWLNGKKK